VAALPVAEVAFIFASKFAESAVVAEGAAELVAVVKSAVVPVEVVVELEVDAPKSPATPIELAVLAKSALFSSLFKLATKSSSEECLSPLNSPYVSFTIALILLLLPYYSLPNSIT
jgi:hypothetical protein